MSVYERLQLLIENPKKPNPSEWAMDCEDALNEIENKSYYEQALEYIDGIQRSNGAFPQQIDMLVAILKRALRSLDVSNDISPIESIIDETVENSIEAKYREFFEKFSINDEFEGLYTFIDNKKLKAIFATSHHELNNLFHLMNQRLPTGDAPQYYWAEQSRYLIFIIDLIFDLRDNLKGTKYSFVIDEYYKLLFEECRSFLRNYRGSEIPANHPKINLQFVKPIFYLQNTIKIKNSGSSFASELKLIGEGSYAKVYKYKDSFYNIFFALKRAKNNLNHKELERFKKEYEVMKMLSSPYIVDVYSYNENNNEYIMEYMDETLEKYISHNNDKLDWSKRKGIAAQVLRGFEYTQSKKILHRDISPNNLLVKKYEDGSIVVKISDFGLVKMPDSALTSVESNLKGAFNDPSLRREGFANYNVYHESYALTLIVYFIMTGRKNIEKENNKSLKLFLDKGLNNNNALRYKSAEEILVKLQDLKEE